jgi:diguanylate cyclase (GGDEF)-like protein
MKRGKVKSTFNFEKFWQRSLASAVASKLILEKIKDADTEEIFVSGLLQNLGELIFARTLPEKYEQVIQAQENKENHGVSLEDDVLGVNHAYIGYEVAKKWGFPEGLLQPIIHHHDPTGYSGGDPKTELTIRAVYLSDLLTNILFSDKPQEYHKDFRKMAQKLLNLKNEDIESILSEFHFQIEQAGEYFDLHIRNTKSVQEILQEANIRLSLLNLDYDQMNKQLIRAKISLENMTRELEAKNKVLDNLANVDGLTGVFNHRYFQNTLEQEISRATRHESSLSLLLVDIDHFKVFNDTYGHQVGDFVLTQFAATLKAHLRNYDTLSRYGGEEFAIILPETSEEEAYLVAEKLRGIIAGKTFEDSRHSYTVTASFGLSTCRPGIEDDFTKSNFICQADEALYGAKDKGRNLVLSYSPKKRWFSFS